MSERVTLSLDAWSSMPPDEIHEVLGITNTPFEVSTHPYESTHIKRLGQPQQFNVLVADARRDDADPTIVMSASYDYRIDALLEMKATLIAHLLNARVAVSEVPGITKGLEEGLEDKPKGDFMSLAQMVEMSAGNFDRIGLEQWRAFDSVLDFRDGEVVESIDESLGANISAARARALARSLFHKRVHIRRMDLIEPVNSYGNHTLLKQIAMVGNLHGIETERRWKYLRENKEFAIPVDAFEMMSPRNKEIDQTVKKHQAVQALVAGAGLRRGFHTAIRDALRQTSQEGPMLHKGLITIAHGIDSTVSRKADVLSAARDVVVAGGNVQTLEFVNPDGEAGHHILDSLLRLASYVVQRAQFDGGRLEVKDGNRDVTRAQ